MTAATWFYGLGIHVFPTSSKVPVVPKGTSQFDYRCTQEQAARFKEYGVPLGSLAVADSDDAVSEVWVAAHLPDTPFKVTTARGRHRYYRLVSDAPHFIHRDGHTIEFRHRGQYVVGPGSIRPDGVVYTSEAWSWDINDLPIFPVADFAWDDRPLAQRGSADGSPFVMPPVVKAGERHDMMFKFMRSLQARGVSELPWLLKAIHAENLLKCQPPIAHDELERYISRVWKYPDRPNFERAVQDEWTLAGGLFNAGVSVETAFDATKAVHPDFDPYKVADLDVLSTVKLDSPPNAPRYHRASRPPRGLTQLTQLSRLSRLSRIVR